MKRSLAWLAGIVGIAALGRLLSRRTSAPPESEERSAPSDAATEETATAADPAADPAEELRRKLAAQRPPEVEADPAVVDETLEERRARVHAKAREAMDAMNEEGPVA